jgi:bacterial leucyl aminopeptidase
MMKFLFIALVLCVVAVSASIEHDEIRTIELEGGVIKQLPFSKLLALREKGVHFMDLTESTLSAPYVFDKPSFPSNLSHVALVEELFFPLINPGRLAETDKWLSSYFTRYFRSDTGRSSSLDIAKHLLNITATYNYPASITVVQSSSYPQVSVVATIHGTELFGDEVVVAGAHLDSISGGLRPATTRSPGADDDGSGSSTLLEVFAVLAEGNFKPLRTVEFQWYAAEEVYVVVCALFAGCLKWCNALVFLD